MVKNIPLLNGRDPEHYLRMFPGYVETPVKSLLNEEQRAEVRELARIEHIKTQEDYQAAVLAARTSYCQS